jgi:prevent-host-death family protein
VRWRRSHAERLNRQFARRAARAARSHCLTGDTLLAMASVTIRDLRNHGGEVVERAARGEPVTITRAGKPVAELHAIPKAALSAETLLDRWRGLPRLDPLALRRDVDRALDSSL